LAVELYEMSGANETILIASAVPNSDGRTDRPLIGDRPIPIAQYEMRFAVGDHYARMGTPVTDPPFLGVVPIRFSIAEPEGHYHVPLLVTPWSYSTYRGS
jgi:2-oxo-4-hydroxy-4-carboxy-5-ureidoimidazoline decarboxylase